MTAKLSEIDALKEIDQLLEHLTEDEHQRIFNYVGSKYTISIASKGSSSFGGPSSGGVHAGGSGASFGSDTTVKDFLAAKKPKGFYEQIACLGYFLEKIQGLESFGAKEITEANVSARVTKIPHTSLYLKNCFAQYGYLVQVGSGKKALSARGEALVEALPDRDAVKTALESNPSKKKAAPKKKKAKK